MKGQKKAKNVTVGDIVIPASGRYYGIQCRVVETRSVEFRDTGNQLTGLKVIPSVPVAEEWFVAHDEPVTVIQ